MIAGASRIAITEHPTAAWTTQQCRDAFPRDEATRYLLRDRDHAFDHVKIIGMQEVLTAPGSPWQHLRRILNEYVSYDSRTRTHLGLKKDAPLPRAVAPLTAGRVIAIPQVGGLHHRYERAA